MGPEAKNLLGHAAAGRTVHEAVGRTNHEAVGPMARGATAPSIRELTDHLIRKTVVLRDHGARGPAKHRAATIRTKALLTHACQTPHKQDLTPDRTDHPADRHGQAIQRLVTTHAEALPIHAGQAPQDPAPDRGKAQPKVQDLRHPEAQATHVSTPAATAHPLAS